MDEHSADLERVVARLTSSDQGIRLGCKKCGFPGHLTYQCRNVIPSSKYSSQGSQKATGRLERAVSVSSTSSDSSEEFVSPLTKLAKEEQQSSGSHKTKRSRSRNHKGKRKPSSGRASDTDSEGSDRLKSRKTLKKKRKSPERKKKRRTSRSSSETRPITAPHKSDRWLKDFLTK